MCLPLAKKNNLIPSTVHETKKPLEPINEIESRGRKNVPLRACSSTNKSDNEVSATNSKKKSNDRSATLNKKIEYRMVADNLIYYARYIKRTSIWGRIAFRHFPRTRNDISSLREHWKSIVDNPKAFARVKKSTEALLARNNGCLDNYILSADGCKLELITAKYYPHSDISSSVMYYARVVKQIKSWTQVSRLFFPNSKHNHQPDRLRGRWRRLLRNQTSFERVKKDAQELVAKYNGSLDNYIVSADECELEFKSKEAKEAMRVPLRPLTELENQVLCYACVWKNMTSWRVIEKEFFPQSTRFNLSRCLSNCWQTMQKNQGRLEAIRKSTEKLVRKHGGSLDNAVVSPDGSKLVICEQRPPTRITYKHDKTKTPIPFTCLEDNFIFYAREIKKMRSWNEISRQFFAKSKRKNARGSIKWHWDYITTNAKHLIKKIKKSTEQLIKKHGGSLDKFILSPDGSELVVRDQ
ncbi:hypothetical protein Ciccas_012136 [Cichlidogyrus casuarinus]|uniref:Uncharacterized protein n=1 Tax=Cichlidogyrus casuarinus TaxID=1844966 RepID=A0ABD2PQN2_9PLAT